jgi:hypothetical protein
MTHPTGWPPGVRAAVPDISATGMILATREEVIAGEVTGSSGRRWRPTDREWADSGRLAGAGRPSHVAGPGDDPGRAAADVDYSSTPPRLCCETLGILARHLAAAGVRDAQIDLAPTFSEQRYGIVGSLTPVARAGIRAPVALYPR